VAIDIQAAASRDHLQRNPGRRDPSAYTDRVASEALLKHIAAPSIA